MPASVVHVPTFLRASVVYVSTFLRDIVVYVTTCQVRSNFSFLRTNVTNVPSAIRHANVSTWRANVPILELGVPTCQKAYQFFKRFLRNAKGNFYALLLYKKFIILDVILIRIMCMCIVHKNCTILHFYTFHAILKKIVRNFCFLKLFALYLEMKI